jgi:hypothetical protein
MKRWMWAGLAVAGGALVFAGFAVKRSGSGADTVWVTRSAQAESCGSEGEPVEAARKALEQAGVKVLEGKRADDGMMHMQMCGADTGQLNAFQISRADLEKAVAAGFALKASEVVIPEK